MGKAPLYLFLLLYFAMSPMATATTYNYNRTSSNTSGTADQWSAGTNWNAVPVSAADTTLRIGNGATLNSGVTVFTNNDFAGDFKLNVLDLSYHWTGTGFFPEVTISGNRLEFLSNGAMTPAMEFHGDAFMRYTISNDLLLTNNLTVNGSFSNLPTTLSGVISGPGSLTKQGVGELVMTGVNTYTGGTIIDGDTLSTTHIGNAGAPGLGTGGITITDNGTLNYIGTGETTNKVLNYGGSTMRIHSTGFGPVTFTADMTATTAGDKTLMLLGANGEIASNIFDYGAGNKTSVIVNSWTLSGANTYTGKTTISNGTLTVGSINSVVGGAASSNMGAPTTVEDGTIDFMSPSTTLATLRYTGTGETTDRVINLADNVNGDTVSGAIEQAGTGLLKFTSDITSVAPAFGSGTKTLFLQGSTSGTGEVAGHINDHDPAHKLAIYKAGTGTWTLSTDNSYTGTTTVGQGTLLINGNQSAATGAVSVNNVYQSVEQATLGGTGTIGGPVTVSGGKITAATEGTVGILALNGNATFVGAFVCSECDGANGVARPSSAAAGFVLAAYVVDLSGPLSDKLVIGGVLDLSDANDQIVFNGTPDGTSSYVLATYASVSGEFNSANTPAGYELVYSANQLVLAIVPEPGTWTFIAVGLAFVAAHCKRQRRS